VPGEVVIVAWSGHRPDLFRDPDAAKQIVRSQVEALAETRGVTFRIGGQRGVDCWAGEAARDLGVPLRVYLPLPEKLFTKDWLPAERAALAALIGAAEEVRVLAEKGEAGYSARNQALVEGADLLVAVWTGQTGGGTEETIRLARENGCQVRELLLNASPGARRAQGRGI
jgi:uncharacterized phage-like protein YoqJ